MRSETGISSYLVTYLSTYGAHDQSLPWLYDEFESLLLSSFVSAIDGVGAKADAAGAAEGGCVVPVGSFAEVDVETLTDVGASAFAFEFAGTELVPAGVAVDVEARRWSNAFKASALEVMLIIAADPGVDKMTDLLRSASALAPPACPCPPVIGSAEYTPASKSPAPNENGLMSLSLIARLWVAVDNVDNGLLLWGCIRTYVSLLRQRCHRTY